MTTLTASKLGYAILPLNFKCYDHYYSIPIHSDDEFCHESWRCTITDSTGRLLNEAEKQNGQFSSNFTIPLKWANNEKDEIPSLIKFDEKMVNEDDNAVNEDDKI